MKPYVYDQSRSYMAYLQQAAAEGESDDRLTPLAALLIGTPTPGGDATAAAISTRNLFHWGRTEVLMEDDALSTPLPKLKEKAHSTAEMWAYEQFDVARDTFRRELWQEAADYLERAIHGDEAHAGYELEFRFHYLLGLIRLGNFRHHDADLLNFKEAAEAFFTAGRLAKLEHPATAARAYFAAGWACYVQGQMGEALAHTNLALSLNGNQADIQFQVAKLLLRQNQPEEARPHFARAVTLEPGYAAQAMRDGDYEPHLNLVFEVLEAERLNVGRQASQILRNVVERAGQLGLFKTDQEPDRTAIEERGFGAMLTAVEQSRQFSREYSLYGYLRSVVAATQANEALIATLARTEKARVNAEETLRKTEERIAQVTALQVDAYRLSRISSRDLSQAATLMETARKAMEKNTLKAFEEAEGIAGGVMEVLAQSVEHFRTVAMQQAIDENAALEAEVAALRARRSKEGSAVKLCAMIGAVLALLPGSYFSLFAIKGTGDMKTPELVLRSVIGMGLFALFGALIGTLFAPIMSSDGASSTHALEKRIAALKQVMTALREVSLQKANLPAEHKISTT